MGAAIEELNYSIVARRTLGEGGDLVADASICIINLGGSLSYMILVGSLTTSVLREWTDTGSPSAFARLCYSFYFMTPLVILIFVLPPCLIRHLSNLRWLAAFSVLAIIGLVSLIVIGGPTYASFERKTLGHDPALDAPVLWWSWIGMVTKAGSAVFSLNSAAAALHCYSAMEKREESEWKVALTWAKGIGFILCYGTGVVGYLSFRAATNGDILANFTGGFASCFKVLVVLHLLMYIPNDIVIMRHSIFMLARRDVMDSGFVLVAAVTFGILATAWGIVIVLMLIGFAEGELFGYIVNFSGGVSGSLLAIILPFQMYLHATRGVQNSPKVVWNRQVCYVLRALGLAIMMTVPVGITLSIFTR